MTVEEAQNSVGKSVIRFQGGNTTKIKIGDSFIANSCYISEDSGKWFIKDQYYISHDINNLKLAERGIVDNYAIY